MRRSRSGLSSAGERRDGGVETHPGAILLYVPDADGAYKRALKAGATSVREPMDAFYGDRTAGVKDSFGNTWWIATHTEDVSREEIERRAAIERNNKR